MNAFEKFEIGSPVHCHTGRCGELTCVVVDPVADRLTHLIVVARDGAPGRLVPVELVRTAGEGVVLTCSRDEFDALEPSRTTHFLTPSGVEERYGYQEGEVVHWPFYGLARG